MRSTFALGNFAYRGRKSGGMRTQSVHGNYAGLRKQPAEPEKHKVGGHSPAKTWTKSVRFKKGNVPNAGSVLARTSTLTTSCQFHAAEAVTAETFNSFAHHATIPSTPSRLKNSPSARADCSSSSAGRRWGTAWRSRRWLRHPSRRARREREPASFRQR